MNNFTEQLTQDIKKLVGILKDEEELREILKKRLTKKEFKYYKLRLENSNDEQIKTELTCDDERLKAIKKQTLLKINQEKLKYELCD